MKIFRRRDKYTYTEQNYNIYKDVKDNHFSPLVNTIFEKNESFNILGPTGCGKSYLLKQLQQELKKQNKNYCTLAPTNKATIIIHGLTLHKFVSKMKSTKIIKIYIS